MTNAALDHSIAPSTAQPWVRRIGRTRCLRWALPVAFILTTVSTLWTGGVLDRSQQLRFGHDLITPYTVGRMILAGEGSRLYDPAAVEAAGRRVMTDANLYGDPRQVRWLNPGWFAAPFAVLAVLPYRWALVVWTVANTCLFVGAAAALLRWFPPARRRLRFGFALALLTSCPFLLAFGHQQNTFVSLALLVGISSLVRSEPAGRVGPDQDPCRNDLSFRAGLLAGLLAYKPQLAAGVGLVLAIAGGRQAVAGLGVSGLAMLVLGEVVAPGSTAAFVREVPAAVSAFQSDPAYNWGRQVTPTAFWRAWGGPAATWPGPLGTGTTVAVLGMLALATWRARRALPFIGAADGVRAIDMLSLAVLALPLAAPYFMDYDLLLLAVPAAARLSVAVRPRSPMLTWAALGLAAFANVDAVAAFGVNLVPLLVGGLFATTAWRAGSLARAGRPAAALVSATGGGDGRRPEALSQAA